MLILFVTLSCSQNTKDAPDHQSEIPLSFTFDQVIKNSHPDFKVLFNPIDSINNLMNSSALELKTKLEKNGKEEFRLALLAGIPIRFQIKNKIDESILETNFYNINNKNWIGEFKKYPNDTAVIMSQHNLFFYTNLDCNYSFVQVVTPDGLLPYYTNMLGNDYAEKHAWAISNRLLKLINQ